MVISKEGLSTRQIFNTLSDIGVNRIFGCEDESLIKTNDEVEYYRLRTEQAAVHAAEGYARATGKPGVVIINSPAGITNAVTGIATAHSDSVPLMIISGQLFFKETTQDAFERLDVSGMMMPITKYSVKITRLQDLPDTIADLYKIAMYGRPGPVLIEILDDFIDEKTTYLDEFSQELKTIPNVNEKLLDKVVAQLEKAKKPVLFIGGGVIISEASDALQKIVERTNIPVVSSLMGIGSFDVKSPLFLGMLGMHGTYAANRAVHFCDLLICVGVRFSDRVTGKIDGFSPHSKKVHVDIDPAEINKIVPVDMPIVADAKRFFTYVDEHLESETVNNNIRSWVNEVTNWKRTVPQFDSSKSILSPQKVIQLLDEYSPDETVVVTDVGQHQIFTAHNYAFKNPRTFLTSGGLGTMGFGFPAAIGASVVNKNNNVICVTGDGSFQMNIQELITAIAYNLPIKIAILNNGYLGMVRQWQEMFYDRRYSFVKMASPNFVKVAESYGIFGLNASTEDEARDVIQKAFSHDGPVLMEFDVVEEENVYPIVPPNSYNHELIISRENKKVE